MGIKKLSTRKIWTDSGFAPYAMDDLIHCAEECVYFDMDPHLDGCHCQLNLHGSFLTQLDKGDGGLFLRHDGCINFFGNGGQK